MKLLLTLFLSIAIVLAVLISGCDLRNDQSPNSGGTPSGSGQDLILTEVFTISPDKYYAYSWLEIYNPTNRTIPWNDVTYPAYGYAVGGNGAILNTFDDGESWTDTLSQSQLPLTLNSIGFPNPDTGFIVGNQTTVLKVNRHGVIDLSARARLVVPDHNINFNAVGVSEDVTNRIAFIVGDKGTALRTVDRGITWTAPRSPLGTTRSLRAIAVQFPRLFAAGDSGAFYQSSNSGTNWFERNPPEPYRPINFHGLTFVADTGWAVGDRGTILSMYLPPPQPNIPPPIVWTGESTHVTTTLRGIFMAPLQASFKLRVGWAVGDEGTLLRTDNGGSDWTSVNSGTQTQLNSVTFADSLRGWIFGDQGLILATTDGGSSWHQQNSGTTNDLKCGTILPLLIQVQNFYVLQMYGQRSYVFFDQQTGTLNTDFVTKIDTGYLLYTPAAGNEAVVQAPGTFVIVSNDSIKFQDHTKLGPGSTKILNFALSVDFDILAGQVRFLKWALLPSSEVRLLKVFQRSVGDNQVEFDSKVIDVVRWGGYRPRPEDYPGHPELLYDQNEPAGFIPEFWSLARYSDDFGGPPNTLNTKNSFFMAKDPIPGWYSQERKPK